VLCLPPASPLPQAAAALLSAKAQPQFAKSCDVR
jgi:hypothetical protein